MNRTLLFLLVLSPAALAQRNDVWSNAALTARGLHTAEQQVVLRQDMSHCHGASFEATRGLDDENRKARGVALFRRCMAEKGWTSRDASAPKPAPRAPKPTST